MLGADFFLAEPLDLFEQSLRVNWLGNIRVHAGRFTLGPDLVTGVGRHRDDGK